MVGRSAANEYRLLTLQAKNAVIAIGVSHNPDQFIRQEMIFVFNHTSRRLADLALGRLLGFGFSAGHRAL